MTGLYPGLPWRDYCARPGYRAGLPWRDYCARPGYRASQIPGPDEPLAALHERETRRVETAQMRVGHAFHTAVLEPDQFEARYARKERATGVGSRGANAARKAEMRAAGITELDDDEAEAVGGVTVLHVPRGARR